MKGTCRLVGWLAGWLRQRMRGRVMREEGTARGVYDLDRVKWDTKRKKNDRVQGHPFTLLMKWHSIARRLCGHQCNWHTKAGKRGEGRHGWKGTERQWRRWKRGEGIEKRWQDTGEEEQLQGSVAAAAAPETENVHGCQHEVIDCHPLPSSLRLTHSTTG